MLGRRAFLRAFALCPICATAAKAAEGAHWSYEGHGGPQDWGSLEQGFAACATGSQQSPVNLDGSVAAESERPKLGWVPGTFRVTNNGHTIQADALSADATASLNGKTYVLKQFHFHTPSEHTLVGAHKAMEAHFVHAAADGGLLVIGVFMQAGRPNATFSEVIAAAPQAAGNADKPLKLDPGALLPAVPTTYRYEGSLTTPPCSEVVDWNVFATPIDVAQADIDAFRGLFPMNARPVQAINRRFLLRLN